MASPDVGMITGEPNLFNTLAFRRNSVDSGRCLPVGFRRALGPQCGLKRPAFLVERQRLIRRLDAAAQFCVVKLPPAIEQIDQPSR